MARKFLVLFLASMLSNTVIAASQNAQPQSQQAGNGQQTEQPKQSMAEYCKEHTC